MSQIAVDNEPGQAYEGKVHLPSPNIASYIASELIPFGKLVFTAATDLTVGQQECSLPTSAAEILLTTQVGGIAIADPSVELAQGDTFSSYAHEDMVPVLRKGQIWVVTAAAVTDLSAGVFVQFQNAGGSPPALSLGSLTPTDTADTEPAPEGFVWVGATTIGGVNFGLLSVNLPA